MIVAIVSADAYAPSLTGHRSDRLEQPVPASALSVGQIVKLTHLHTFVTVAEELHFRRAAERLHVQPSAVSTTIRQLEIECEVALFSRSSRRVSLTPAGEVLLGKAREALAGVDELQRVARSLAQPESFVLRVGFLDEGLAELNDIVHTSYLSRYPGSEVVMDAIDYDEFGEALLSGRIDVGLTTFPEAWFDVDLTDRTPLFAETRVAVLPRAHALARRPQLEMAELLDEPFLRFMGGPEKMHEAFMLTLLRDSVRSPDVEVAVTHMHNALNHVSRGAGLFTVTRGTERFYPRPDIIYVPVRDLPLVTFYATKRSADDRHFVQSYIDECVTVVRSHLDLIPSAIDVTSPNI